MPADALILCSGSHCCDGAGTFCVDMITLACVLHCAGLDDWLGQQVTITEIGDGDGDGGPFIAQIPGSPGPCNCGYQVA